MLLLSYILDVVAVVAVVVNVVNVVAVVDVDGDVYIDVDVVIVGSCQCLLGCVGWIHIFPVARCQYPLFARVQYGRRYPSSHGGVVFKCWRAYQCYVHDAFAS